MNVRSELRFHLARRIIVPGSVTLLLAGSRACSFGQIVKAVEANNVSRGANYIERNGECPPIRGRARARGLARRDARLFDHVTLMRGAAALALATNTLAVPFRPEASSSQQRVRQPALGRRCHAKLAVWLIELCSKINKALSLGGFTAEPVS
jgi:hypothetical protein